jgi:hypothetical protein
LGVHVDYGQRRLISALNAIVLNKANVAAKEGARLMGEDKREEVTYMPWTFECGLCEHSYDFIDGEVYTAHMKIVYEVDGDVRQNTRSLKFCKYCMAKEVNDRITGIDRQGSAFFAILLGVAQY